MFQPLGDADCLCVCVLTLGRVVGNINMRYDSGAGAIVDWQIEFNEMGDG